MTKAALVAIDSDISDSLTVASVTTRRIASTDTVGGKTWSVAGSGPSSTGLQEQPDLRIVLRWSDARRGAGPRLFSVLRRGDTGSGRRRLKRPRYASRIGPPKKAR